MPIKKLDDPSSRHPGSTNISFRQHFMIDDLGNTDHTCILYTEAFSVLPMHVVSKRQILCLAIESRHGRNYGKYRKICRRSD